MNTTAKVLLVALPAAAVGFLLQLNSPVGSAIWPAPPAGPEPTGGALGALVAMGVLEALAFGAGVAWLAFGWPVMKRANGVPTALALGAFLAIGWSLVNWVPHTAMHMTNGAADFARLAIIEYAFHLTMMVGGVLVAFFAIRALQAGAARSITPAAPPKTELKVVR